MWNRVVAVGMLAFGLSGCGDESKSKSSFTSCEQIVNECLDGTCVLREACQIDECKSDIDYDFDGETYKTKCTFGDTLITTTYPLAGGSGRQEYISDLDECYYKGEYDDGDFEEEGSCTRVRACTISTLACDESDPGQPDCDVTESSPCPRT